MARLVDVIEDMIKEIIDENNGSATINRSQLAEQANCVPSQITYVLSTRFSSGQGYIVESRRGGGGQITITRVEFVNKFEYLKEVIDAIGTGVTQQQAKNLLEGAAASGAITQRDAVIIMSAVSDRALGLVESDTRAKVRAQIMKNLLLALISE